MSKFFNDTNSALRLANRGSKPLRSEIDVQDLVSIVKDDLESADQTMATSPGSVLPHSFTAVIDTEAGSPVAKTRLEQCRAVRLPRNDKKSFLAREYNPDLQAAVEAYRTLRTRLLKLQEKTGLRSMVVTSTAQGEGKTLTSLNLGICFSHLQDKSILLVDCDLRTKGLSRLLGLEDSVGLSDLLESGPPFNTGVVRTDFPNLYFVPAGTSSTPATELFSRAYWKEFVAWCGETFSLTLADSPPILDLADTELIIAACESALVVTRAGKTKRQVLAKTLDQVGPKKLAGVVFNACEEAAAKNYYRYSSSGSR